MALAGPYRSGKSGKDGKGKGKMKALLKGAVKGGLVTWGDRPDENCAYFTGLPKDCTDRDLYELCAPFGAIAPQGVKAMTFNGECNGSGFCDFVESSSVESIISTLNGHESLTVTYKSASQDKDQGSW